MESSQWLKIPAVLKRLQILRRHRQSLFCSALWPYMYISRICLKKLMRIGNKNTWAKIFSAVIQLCFENIKNKTWVIGRKIDFLMEYYIHIFKLWFKIYLIINKMLFINQKKKKAPEVQNLCTVGSQLWFKKNVHEVLGSVTRVVFPRVAGWWVIIQLYS